MACSTGSGPIDWIKAHVTLTATNSVDALYEHMESQSGERLPVIYERFNGKKRGHFVDRGQILDFALSVGNGRVLDFGPGDGWPSLMIAPMVEEVVGVDGSRRRVEACAHNAEKLGLKNARFVPVPPGQPLPFDDGSFDGVCAASSVEQTPDPKTTLREISRVLKPGGRLRMSYESLSYYQREGEREMALSADGARSRILIYDRDLEAECVRHYQLLLDLARPAVEEILARTGVGVCCGALTDEVMRALCERLIEAKTWITRHPSCRTLVQWLTEIGFSSVAPTYGGGWFARRLFDQLEESERPQAIEVVDRRLRPIVAVAIAAEAPMVTLPGQWEPPITAVR